MMLLDILSGEVVVLLLIASVLLIGLMAGFFFAYSISVVLALETLSASAYTNMIQAINEKVLNVAFGVVFFGAVAIPVGSAAIVLFRGDWAMQYGQLFLIGVVVYLIGTFAVTMRIHIPMNDAIAEWSPSSPPDEWDAVRARWERWNHVRTVAAIVSFVFSLIATVSFGV